MSELIHVETNRFHVTDANKFKEIMNNVCINKPGKLEITEYKDESISFSATDNILGYMTNDNDYGEYDYEAFIEDLRTVLPENEAIVIYTTYISHVIDVEYAIITKYFYNNYSLHNDVKHCLNIALSVKPSDYVYLVDCGVLESLEQTEAVYVTYDRKYGYYDECQYYEPVFENAQQSALEYVKHGCDGTYAIVSKSRHKIEAFNGENIYDSLVKDEDYDTKSVAYSVAKIDGNIVENFVVTSPK